MLLTGREARKRWCPAMGDYERDRNCVASDCMAWRWDYEESDEGYCGLAGKICESNKKKGE